MESQYYEMTHDFKEENCIAESNFRCGYLKGYHDAVIKAQEQIVRCNECKHGDPCNGGEIYCEKDIGTIETAVHKPDWFCADGRKRDDT